MRLKSLVLKGFKSFADRTAFVFEPGMTAIVGPNGSGKSNISDAVLWVLGERNAKNLRGQAMDDVIFAGSASRKPVGVAEVDLVLDNEDGTLPVDFSEVCLTRRMYKTGESEYLINGSSVRRMDIMDILHDTGLGSGVRSVIGQGNLDAILTSSPEERYALVEEAAGVLKHRQRKERSARKLEALDGRLARAADVAREIERQLKPLARKAARAEEHRAVSEEAACLELALAVDDVRVLQHCWDEVCERERAASDELRAAQSVDAAAASELERLRDAHAARVFETAEIERQSGRMRVARERLDSLSRLLREKERAADDRRAAAHAAREGRVRDLDSLRAACEQGEAALVVLRADADERDRELGAARHALEEACRARVAADASFDECRRRGRLCAEALETAAEQGEAARVAASEYIVLLRSLEERATSLACELDNAAAELARLESEAQRTCAALAEFDADLERATSTVAMREADVVEARAAVETARLECERMAARIASLEESERAFRVYDDASAWMAEHVREFDAAACSLASCVRAPSDIERVVERLLARDFASWCVTDARHARLLSEAFSRACDQGSARVLFAPVAPSAAPQHTARRLIDRLEYPAHAGGLLEHLIGDVVLVDSLDEAWEACEGDGSGRYLTRDGVMVDAGGSVTLCGACAEDGVLACVRELVCARRDAARARTRLVSVEESLVAAEDALGCARACALEAERSYARCKGVSEGAEERVRAAAGRLRALEAARSSADERVAASIREEERLRQACDEALEKTAALKGERAALEDALAASDDERHAAYEEERRARESVARAESALSAATQRSASAQRDCRDARRDYERAARSQERAQAAGAEAETALARMRPLIARIEELRFSVEAALEKTEARLAFAGQARERDEDLLKRALSARDRATARLEAARQASGAVDVDKGKLEVRIKAAVEQLVAHGDVDLESALEIPPPADRAAAEQRLVSLRARLKALGSVDPDAAREYEALKERYDFVAAQMGDIEEAVQSLRRVATALDERMQERFDETFGLVNERFARIFEQLFPGGSAWLSLIDSEGSGRAGIEVHAQPKGKRIAKMTLMSGGEKSLVAIALLFAVHGVRRVPFYLLDEVEAALDDSNLRRLLAYLETLRDRTQVIMITHQRRTMEMADVLYGVSMHADGVTRAVSQRLGRQDV